MGPSCRRRVRRRSHVDAPRLDGLAMASATLSGSSPPARIAARPPAPRRRASSRRPGPIRASERRARSRSVARTARRPRRAGRERLDHPADRRGDLGDVLGRLPRRGAGPPSRRRGWTISTTRFGCSSRNTPTVRISGRQARGDVVDLLRGDLRGDGAKTNPTASAPMATARRASSSFVIPQILTNMRRDATRAGQPVTGPHPGVLAQERRHDVAPTPGRACG